MFNSDELALFTLAFSKRLFPLPIGDELLFDEKPVALNSGRGFYFYFSTSYFDKLANSMRELEKAGKFKESNAASRWIELMHKVELAQEVDTASFKGLKPYPVLIGR